MREGLLQEIDPEASVSDYLRPMIEKMILQEAKQQLTRVRDSTLDAIELGLELPERVDRILAQLERGNLQVWARTPDADALIQRLERVAARINATILAAACVVGLASSCSSTAPTAGTHGSEWCSGSSSSAQLPLSRERPGAYANRTFCGQPGIQPLPGQRRSPQTSPAAPRPP